MEIGTQFQCEIEKTALGGDGLTHINGEVIFLSGALPGEKVIAEITSAHKNFSRAKIIRFGAVSPDRREPQCPYVNRCVGCRYAHCTYELENRLKRQQFLDLAGNSGVELPETVEIFAPRAETGYRNKVVFHARKIGKELFFGYVRDDNENVTDVERCLLAAPEINAEIASVRADPSFVHSLHDRMDVTFRLAGNKVSWWRNQPPRNATWLREDMPFGEISVPPGSFFQVNAEGAGKLAEEVQREIQSSGVRRVIDLYCGAGFFGAAAAAAGIRDVTLVETDAAAVEAARFNLKKFGVESARCIAGDAAKFLTSGQGGAPDAETLLIVDPPRAGLAPQAVGAIGKSALRKMIYISCNPATWNRDAQRLEKNNFRLRKVLLVNMFPRTEHFEVFSIFERGGEK